MKINILSILMFFCVVMLIGTSDAKVFGQNVNLALKTNNPKVTATQSSVSEWTEANLKGTPDHAVDGDTDGGGLAKIAETSYQLQNDSWFEVDLGGFYKISEVKIYPRTDCCQDIFKSAYLIVTDQAIGTAPMIDAAKINSSSTFSKFYDPIYELGNKARTIPVNGSVGRYVRLQIKGGGAIQLAEIEVIGEAAAVADYKPDASKAWSSTIAAVNTLNSGAADASIDPRNLARNASVGAVATQSTIFSIPNNSGKPELAIDGKLDGIAESKGNDDINDWFELDLKNNYKIDKIVINARNDDYGNGCCLNQFHSVWVIVTDQPLPASAMVDEARIYNSSTDVRFIKEPINGKREIEIGGKVGRYIRLQTKDSRIELKEIEVIGEPTPVAAYKPNPSKAWDAVLKIPFDPNYPNFRSAAGEFLSTLQVSPKIVGIKNSANSFDVAYQDLYGDGSQVKVNTYIKDGANIKKDATKSMSLTGLGVFGGFTKDAAGNRYIFTGAPWTNRGDEGESLVYKNSDVLWNGKFYQGNKTPGRVKSFLHQGGSRLVTSGNSLLITSNFTDAHSYQVILDTQDKSKNTDRAFYESLYQHNFGQRAIFDGTNFVIMENRDHDVSVTLTKLSPTDVLPLKNYAAGIFSVYSHANFANNTYTDLGNVEKGLDNGYLVLFASEQDSNYKLKDYISAGYVDDKGKSLTTPAAPYILSPRNIGLVHVKNNFNAGETNWLDDKNLVQCPSTVDNSKIVNSSGETKTVAYKFKNDGWDWKDYGCPDPKITCVCRDKSNKGEADRTLVTKGVKWVTTFSKESGNEFTSVNHPKLVRISGGKYVVLWEEWKAEVGQPKKSYVTTRAASLILSNNNGSVDIQVTSTKDIGKVRLMPGDDAFEFDGKAAWAVGDSMKGKLAFYTVGEDLKLSSYELEP